MFNTNTPRICRTHPFTNQCCPELYQCMRIIYSVLYNTLLCTTLHNTMWCRALVVERTYAPLCARQGVTNRPQTPRASQAGGRQGCWGFSWEGCCALGSVIIKEIRVAIWGHPRVSQPGGSQYEEGLDIGRRRESVIKQIRLSVKASMLVEGHPSLSRRTCMTKSSLGLLLVAEC